MNMAQSQKNDNLVYSICSVPYSQFLLGTKCVEVGQVKSVQERILPPRSVPPTIPDEANPKDSSSSYSVTQIIGQYTFVRNQPLYSCSKKPYLKIMAFANSGK